MKSASVAIVVAVVVAGAWACVVLGRSPAKSASSTQANEQTNEQGAGKSEAKPVKVSVFNKAGKLVRVETPKVVKTDAEWQKQLTREQYLIARAKGTERPFCGNLLDNHQDGVYTCVCCGLPLFSSDAKFQSGTGWPSFFKPVAEGNVIEHTDETHGMVRTEILCARCDGHLGHVFEDGPRPTGLRFCVNSESLSFTPSAKLDTLADPAAEAVASTAPSSRPATKG